jgi:FkbM family methyltransferase
MKIPRPRLNLVELGLLAVLVAVFGFLAGQYQNQMRVLPFIDGGSDLRALEQRYGPARNSRFGEEWIVRDFFKDKRGGVFVDVGANHYQRESNTYYLDVELGWSGIAIEPQTKFAADYKTYRPRTTFVPLFVSDTSNREAVLQVPKNNDLIASADAAFVRSSGGVDIEPVRANTTTLDDVLQRSGIETIDFLSMDIELHEPIALKGFSIERYRPRLVAVEAHLPVRQQILDYFAGHGYVVAGNYLRADSANLWFIPINPEAK